MAEADSIGTGDLQGQWPQFHTGVDLLGWTGNCFILGNNHQVMKAHGKFSVISGTVSLADLWSFLILSEIQDRYMMQISQRCVLILWCCSYLVNVLFPCCPIFFSLTTACAKSGYLVDLLNYLSFYKHPVNYTRGINVYIYIYTVYRYCTPPKTYSTFSWNFPVFAVFFWYSADPFTGFSGPSR